MIRTYTELRQLETFEERFEYLRLGGLVGFDTFGYDRYMNQRFYSSREWRTARQRAILRDHGCDLGVLGFEINGMITIHHLNPLTPDDIVHGDQMKLLDLNNLITTTHQTHNAIHYGNPDSLQSGPVERSPGDTKLW